MTTICYRKLWDEQGRGYLVVFASGEFSRPLLILRVDEIKELMTEWARGRPKHA